MCAGFKLHLVAFAIGLPLLGVLWVLTEYYEEHSWPSRFASDPDVVGTWDPWLFFVAGLWLIILVIHALRTYLGPPLGPIGRYIRRPVTQADLDRECPAIACVLRCRTHENESRNRPSAMRPVPVRRPRGMPGRRPTCCALSAPDERG